MMNTWLMRRPVRSPVSRATTAPSSSSVCRLPFISSSASPSRTSSTAFAAAAWLCGTSTIRTPREVDAVLAAISWIFGAGPTRIGTISPCWPASTAPARADCSQGWATAVGTGGRPWQRAISCSYFPVPVCGVMDPRRSGVGDEFPRLRSRRLLPKRGRVAVGLTRSRPRAYARLSRARPTRRARLRRSPCTWSSSPSR